ncbi:MULTISPECIES: hypothetical protein [Actinomycetes]|uniref:arsenate reductase/protein-tyrosine-phosphatase family protein n=1 Tax=Actinomycetes TaxID=1760 RepID=UPI0009DD04B5
MDILFVCTGNICRSPLAERMLQQIVSEQGLDVRVSSAGTRALNGQPMHPQSERVLIERGIEPGPFESRMLTAAMAEHSDLVLGMTRQHRAFARQLAPARWKRMFALRELNPAGRGDAAGVRSRAGFGPTDSQLDIEDPINRPGEVFDRIGGVIFESMAPVIAWIGRRETGAYPPINT